MTIQPPSQKIPRPVFLVLMSWGLAVLIISGLLSAWIYTNQREAEAQRDKLQAEQDQAMCAMIEVFTSGPEAPAGPEGDRSRKVQAAMNTYRAALHCDVIRPRD